MKQIFLATSFSDQVHPDTGEVMPEFREKIEAILAGLREETGMEVFCAVEDEDWRIDNSPPEIGVQHDLDILKESDIMVALMGKQISAGVQFEIGYCVGVGKPVILAVPRGEKLAYYNQGAVSAGWITLVTYEDVKSFVTQVTVAVNTPEEVLS